MRRRGMRTRSASWNLYGTRRELTGCSIVVASSAIGCRGHAPRSLERREVDVEMKVAPEGRGRDATRAPLGTAQTLGEPRARNMVRGMRRGICDERRAPRRAQIQRLAEMVRGGIEHLAPDAFRGERCGKGEVAAAALAGPQLLRRGAGIRARRLARDGGRRVRVAARAAPPH